MSEPKFNVGEKVEFREYPSAEWVLVHILSSALEWAEPSAVPGSVYLVRHHFRHQGQQAFLAAQAWLRPVERWEPCPGRHRPVGYGGGFTHDKLERRVE